MDSVKYVLLSICLVIITRIMCFGLFLFSLFSLSLRGENKKRKFFEFAYARIFSSIKLPLSKYVNITYVSCVLVRNESNSHDR